MALVKQPIAINFTGGLDLKTDPKQVKFGKFLSLVNSIFQIGARLTKRNGFKKLSLLPDKSYVYSTTLNGNLTAVGSSVAAFNEENSSWVTKGTISPVSLSVLPLIRNSINQTQCDAAVASNGLVCTTYTETNGGTTTHKYSVSDSVTGQNIVNPIAIPVSSGVVTGSSRVFILGNYFVIVFTNVISATSHLQYVSVSISNPTQVTANADIAAAYASSTTVAWDAIPFNGNLYIAYNTATGGQAIKITYLAANEASIGGAPVSAVTFAGYHATLMSLCVDSTVLNPVIYISFYYLSGTVGYTIGVDQSLNTSMIPIQTIPSGTVLNLTSVAKNGVCTLFYEASSAYSYDNSIPSNYIASVTVAPSGAPVSFHSVFSSSAATITASSATGLANGMYVVDNTTLGNLAAKTTFTISGTTLTLSASTTGSSASSPGDSLSAQAVTLGIFFPVVLSVGLASKAFLINGTAYFLAAYSSSYQPTYFFINGSTSVQASPVIVAKLAYSNGGGYLTLGLPSVSVNNGVAQIPYLFKDLIQAANKDTNVPSGTQINGIYSQTGVNLASITIGSTDIDTAEIGKDLHLSGGFLWMYDGNYPVEHNFFLWPDNVEVTSTSSSGGHLAAQVYYYVATYEWADNQGNIFRSAPSIPVAKDLSGAGTSTSQNTIQLPTIRLTYKTQNQAKIVIYRWSTAQPVYYQVTSISSALMNDTTSDSVSFTDTLADATILGNNILYTTGGVLENVNAPGSNIMTLFDTRLWTVDAEDQNLLWYSKQVIEATPVEMSDLLTYYVAPNTGTSSSTGPITALAPMDDKLVIFKEDAIYYINGRGPDNTGANNQYSQPIFVTSSVGCSNQQSIALTPSGLMFQSDKGIWMLGRDLSTQYIGAPVEAFNSATVQSAVNVPGTTQIRFTLNSGVTLMYDYFYGEWGTFLGIPAISSCIYNGLHTFINSFGQVYQENPGSYIDGSNPVLMAFTTGEFNLAGIQGYERFYDLYLLGTYVTPFKLNVGIAYDYSQTVSQQSLVAPTNYSGAFGSDPLLGQTTPLGGPGTLFRWRLQPKQQLCQSFRISAQEIFDSSFQTVAGEGLTLSSLVCQIGMKKGVLPIRASNQTG